MAESLTSQLGYLTADIPGAGGVIKQQPEDFVVQELPLYEPSGQGEHLYMLIQKRMSTTMDVVRRLAKLFKVKQRDIGYAGLKDKHAVTQQYFSVYLPDARRDRFFLDRLKFTNYHLIHAARHGNKLRRGHLRGNRFHIRIRKVEPIAVLRAQKVLERLARQGVPNFIGEQRFGYRQNNHRMGRALVLGQYQALLDDMLGPLGPDDNEAPGTTEARQAYQQGDYARALELWPKRLRHDRQALDALRRHLPAQQAVEHIDAQQRDFILSSLQSAIFNDVLNHRLAQGCFDRLLPGDVAIKHDNRACFAVDQATADKENHPTGRVRSMEVSPSGPMWGSQMMWASDQPGHWEADALHRFGLTEQDLAQSEIALDGTRRPLRTIMSSPQLERQQDEQGDVLQISFDLERGSYATIVLREVIKHE